MKTVVIDGRSVPLTQAARQSGLAYSTLHNRISKADDESAVRRALREPPRSAAECGRMGKAKSPWRHPG